MRWSSAVLSVMRTSSCRMPSRLSSSQSPPGEGSTVPLSSSPSKVPPVTVAMRRRPYGVSPTSVMLGSTVRLSVNRWEVRSVGSVMIASNPCRAAGPVGFAQFAFHDLADGAARQRIAELHGSEPLGLAELAVRPVADFLFRGRGAGPAHAERHRRFAPLIAWDADHRHVDHVRMLQQQHLDVGGIDIEATGDDHVLLAVEQDDETVLVDATHVARLEEELALVVEPEQIARLVGLLVVALHHQLGAAGKLAHLALRQHLALLVEDDDLAAQARLAHGVQLVRIEVGDQGAARSALGQAVDFD